MNTALTIADRFRMSETLAQARGMLPRHVTSPAEAFAIIQAGAELGFEPMEALRTITLVQGKVTIAADAQLGLAIRKGVKPQWVEQSNTSARLRLTRDGFEPHEHTFTMDDAKTAGLMSNPTWRKYPAAMLRARCITAAIRAFCPDVLASCYDPDELGMAEADVVQDDPPPVRPAPEPVAEAEVVEPVELDAEGRHPSWAEDRVRFCARLTDLGVNYDHLKAYLAALGKPKPSAIEQAKRDGLMAWLEKHAEKVNDWKEAV